MTIQYKRIIGVALMSPGFGFAGQATAAAPSPINDVTCSLLVIAFTRRSVPTRCLGPYREFEIYQADPRDNGHSAGPSGAAAAADSAENAYQGRDGANQGSSVCQPAQVSPRGTAPSLAPTRTRAWIAKACVT